jgi:hypothetical protein
MTARIPRLVVRLGTVLVVVAGLMMGGPLTAGVGAPAATEIVGGYR